MSITLDVSRWQRGRPLANQATLHGPDHIVTFVLQAECDEDVMVVDHFYDGKKRKLLQYHVEHRPFKTVVANIKRAFTRKRNKEARHDA
jgi:hypothetical protein